MNQKVLFPEMAAALEQLCDHYGLTPDCLRDEYGLSPSTFEAFKKGGL